MGCVDVERLFSYLNKLKPLSLKTDCDLQQLGHKNSIFLLEKSGEHYYLMPSPLFDDHNVIIPNLCDGVFMYAILANYPQQVMVGANYSNPSISKAQAVEGHSSIALRGDVLYAGELEFFENRLIYWNNESGHYVPPSEMRHTQLTPNVRRLLPEELFTDIFLGLF